MTRRDLVVIDTMVVSAMVKSQRDPVTAAEFRELIAGRPVVVSFATVTEMRYGARKAHWGELRRRSLERTLSEFVVAQPVDELMTVCAELRYNCERRGVALGQKAHEADRWIAATALYLKADLVSDDAGFQGIKDLTVLSRRDS